MLLMNYMVSVTPVNERMLLLYISEYAMKETVLKLVCGLQDMCSPNEKAEYPSVRVYGCYSFSKIAKYSEDSTSANTG